MINFCTQCGQEVNLLIPQGDTHQRHVCTNCGHIHYENPRLIVGCVSTWDNKILLCRRAIEPRLGYWTLPAGFMENGETTAEAAVRETWEEAGARIAIDAPFSMISIAHINQVHLFYRGRLMSPEYSAGEESLEVILTKPEAIPWSDFAFQSVEITLRRFLAEAEQKRFSFHESVLAPNT